jgi:hypothetical protein
MYRAGNLRKVALSGLVKADNLNPVADLSIRFNKLPHSLRRTAIGRAKTGNDMKYLQNRPRFMREPRLYRPPVWWLGLSRALRPWQFHGESLFLTPLLLNVGGVGKN